MENKKILIVEDDKGMADTIQARLSAEGFLAEAIYEGTNALERISAFCPDVVLLDIGLPGKDGRDILSAMKKDEKQRKIPVVIISGRDQQHDRLYGLELGAIDYIIKPFSLLELSNKIKRLLETPR